MVPTPLSLPAGSRRPGTADLIMMRDYRAAARRTTRPFDLNGKGCRRSPDLEGGGIPCVFERSYLEFPSSAPLPSALWPHGWTCSIAWCSSPAHGSVHLHVPPVAYGHQKVVYHVNNKGPWHDRNSEAFRLVHVVGNTSGLSSRMISRSRSSSTAMAWICCAVPRPIPSLPRCSGICARRA